MEKVLLVEGPDDRHVVRGLCERHNVEVNFSIVEKGGIDPLLESIYSEANVSGRRALGILADANANLVTRWQAIAQQLHRAGIEVPRSTRPGGVVVPGFVRIGVWLMPDNRRTGELEDFLVDLIGSNDAIWPHAEEYVEAIPGEDRRFQANKITKAKVHAWLAVQKEPRQSGQAIRFGDMESESDVAAQLVSWLEECFA